MTDHPAHEPSPAEIRERCRERPCETPVVVDPGMDRALRYS